MNNRAIFSFLLVASFMPLYGEDIDNSDAFLNHELPTRNMKPLSSAERKKVTFKGITKADRLLSLADGRIIGADKIRKINYIIQVLVNLQYGNIDSATKKRTGIFKHSNKEKKEEFYDCVKKSLKLEKEYKANYKHLKESKNPQDNAAYEKNMEPINHELDRVKKIYNEITADYLGEAKGTKDIMLVLITIWAGLVGAPSTPLKRWAQTTNEQESFNKYVNSFEDMDIFFTDLLDFLVALKNSCPLAMQLYAKKYGK